MSQEDFDWGLLTFPGGDWIRPLPRHMSYEAERLWVSSTPCGSSEREAAFARCWMRWNHPRLRAGTNYGLGVLVDLVGVDCRNAHSPGLGGGYKRGPCWPVRRRDCQVAATVVQWLGTNIGMCFLEEALQRAGFRLVQIQEGDRTG